jgi:hypothetical protein
MPTYRVSLAKSTTAAPVWDFAETVVAPSPDVAIQRAYENWLHETPGLPALNQLRFQAKPVQ